MQRSSSYGQSLNNPVPIIHKHFEKEPQSCSTISTKGTRTGRVPFEDVSSKESIKDNICESLSNCTNSNRGKHHCTEKTVKSRFCRRSKENYEICEDECLKEISNDSQMVYTEQDYKRVRFGSQNVIIPYHRSSSILEPRSQNEIISYNRSSSVLEPRKKICNKYRNIIETYATDLARDIMDDVIFDLEEYYEVLVQDSYPYMPETATIRKCLKKTRHERVPRQSCLDSCVMTCLSCFCLNMWAA